MTTNEQILTLAAFITSYLLGIYIAFGVLTHVCVYSLITIAVLRPC